MTAAAPATVRPAPGLASAAAWQPSVNPWLIAVSMILPTFMVALDTSVANVALPHIAGSLSATADEATAVLTSYLVANAVVLPATGWMSQFFGRKRFLIASVLLFTASSVFCGAAWSLGMIIVARVLQGASGGALLPVSQAVLLESFPPADRGEAMAAYGLGVIVAPIVGPTLGGWITDNYSWRWVFYINVPVGVVAVLLAQWLIEDPPYIRKAVRHSIDYLGFAAMAVGLGTLQIVLDNGQRDDWFGAAWIRWAVALTVVSLALFFWWERRVQHPIVDLRILRDRNFLVGIIMGGVYGVILYGSLVMLPLFLQGLMGYPALDTGLAITPRGVGALFSMVIAGRAIRHLDGRIFIVLGFLMLAWGGLMLGDVNLQISLGWVVFPNIIMGAAMGFIFVPLTTMCVANLPLDKIGTATGIYNLMRNMGGSVGIAIITTLLARDAQRHQAAMVRHLTPYDPAFTHQFGQWLRFYARHGDPVSAAHQAYGAIYHKVVQQATLWAFVDNFRLLGYLALAGIPLTFLLRRRKAKTSVAPLE